MSEAKLNSNFIATVAGEITVFNYDGETREYLSSSEEYLAVGIGIPANSCTDAPGEDKTGTAICRTADLSAWEYIADHRGETVYSTETGKEISITALGNYPDGTTTQVPSTPYDIWDGQKWVTDSDAKIKADTEYAEEQRRELLTEVDAITSDWKIELMLGDISESDKEKLSAWMAYKSAVKAVDISTAPDVAWPIKPELQAS